jgi:hypothetical protein
MSALTEKDILNLIDRISSQKIKSEGIKMFAGEGEDKIVIVSKGLKIKHVPSGIVYTVLKVLNSDDDDPVVVCKRPGKLLMIGMDKISQYERL